MSSAIQKRAVELLWTQWTALGVSGVASMPAQAVDLEALIAFTPYVVTADPRLENECVDWCVRVGRNFVSISRLRQLVRLMPPRQERHGFDLAAMLMTKSDAGSRRLSGKSRPPRLEHPSLLQLRSRYVFGVGARADILSNLVMHTRHIGPERLSTMRPTGYTKQTVATVLDELAQASVLEKLVSGRIVTYQLRKKNAPLRALLAPLPKRFPSWAERFALVAYVLDTWTRLGTRSTYAIELAKVLDGLRPLAAATGQMPPTVGRPKELLERIDQWVVALLQDNP